MGQMRMLKPEIDKLNEMYKEDPQQKGAAMMELYRKRGVSPFGGCLPSLLQMPVWFAFYASLSTNVELYHASFAGWYTDLSAPDPFFVLPLLVGVLMHFQQRLTPVGTDATQAKIMMWLMPIMITSFLLFLPSGLCLYMVTNSVLGMGQQVYIQRNLEKKEAEAKAKAAAEEAAAEEAMKAAEDESADADKGSSVLSRTRLDRKKKKKRKKSA
jgi:YidC/Oxa1 family membrane protein insertase